MSDLEQIKVDIAVLRNDVKYIKKNIEKIANYDCKNIERINTNRKFIYFIGCAIVGIISYLTGIKLL